MSPIGLSPAAGPLSTIDQVKPPEEGLKEAAQAFEAILLRQMLSSARATDFGGNDLFGGEGEKTFAEMRDSQFADIVSQSGQLGFAEAIERQLSRFLPQDDS